MRDREVPRAKIDAARYAASHRAPADLLSRAARAVRPPSARARSPDRSPSRIIIQMHPPVLKALSIRPSLSSNCLALTGREPALSFAEGSTHRLRWRRVRVQIPNLSADLHP